MAAPNRHARLLLAILLVAAALRLWGIWFGLPHVQARPDEDAALGRALEMRPGDLNPSFFHWPSLHFYVLAVVLWLARQVGAVLGGFALSEYAEAAIVARAYVALAGTATVYVVYRLARPGLGERAALAAAAFLAVAVLHVRESHFALTDVPMTLLATLSLALVLHGLRASPGRAAADGGDQPRVSGDGPLAAFAWAGACGGLATSTKYNAAAVAVAMLAAQVVLLWRTRAAPWRIGSWVPTCVYIVVFQVAFFAGTPYALLDAPKFATDFMFTVTHLSEGHGVDLGRGWEYHASVTLPHGLGLGAFALAIAGTVVLARRAPADAFVIGSFATVFYLLVGSGRTVFFRYVLPLVPVLCVCAGAAADAIGTWCAKRLRVSPGRAVAVIACLLAVPSLVNSAWLDLLLSRTDTRVQAARWLRERLPRGATVHETGQEYVRVDLRGEPIHRWGYDEATGAFAGQHEKRPEWLIVHTSPVDGYAPVPPAIVDLARAEYRPVRRFDATVPGSDPGVYDLHDAFFLPIAGFRDVLRPGTTIVVYQRR